MIFPLLTFNESFLFSLKLKRGYLRLYDALSEVLDTDSFGRGPTLINNDVDLLLGLRGLGAGGGELLVHVVVAGGVGINLGDIFT